MKYPDDFSQEAQSAIEAEKIKAEIEFDKAKQPTYHGEQIEVEPLLRNCIMRVVAAFAHAACELGKTRQWSAVTIRDEVDHFLHQVGIAMVHERGFDTRGHPLRDLRNMHGRLRDSFLHRLKSTRHWKDSENKRLEVAELQSKPRLMTAPALPFKQLLNAFIQPEDAPRSPSLKGENNNRNLSERLDALVATEDITHEELARRMKIGKTTYYAVKSGGGKNVTRLKVENYIKRHESSAK